MSVIASCEHGWILDHNLSINKTYAQTYRRSSMNLHPACPSQNTDQSETVKLVCNPDLFAIHEPFLMDSQYRKRTLLDKMYSGGEVIESSIGVDYSEGDGQEGSLRNNLVASRLSETPTELTHQKDIKHTQKDDASTDMKRNQTVNDKGELQSNENMLNRECIENDFRDTIDNHNREAYTKSGCVGEKDELAAKESDSCSQNRTHSSWQLRTESGKTASASVGCERDSSTKTGMERTVAVEQQFTSKKKGKRKKEMNVGEKAAAEYHNKVKDTLLKALSQLLVLGRGKGYFVQEVRASQDNNRLARDAAKIEGPGPTLADACQQTNPGDANSKVLVSKTDVLTNGEVFNTLVDHDSDFAQIVPLLDGQYVLPPGAKFLISQYENWQPLLQNGVKYDLIVMDPPWENKSVKRQKTYNTLTDWDLYKLPLPSLMAQGCHLVVWVTNKQKQIQFIKHQLFPHWGVEYITDWHWLKVTTSGDPVCDMESGQKKPYETLILGRHPISAGDLDPGHSIPQNKVIVSVPCSIHSRKPPLNELFSQYLPLKYDCLELFARNLMPHWTSWGNEVVKYQHLDFFNIQSDLDS